MRTEFNCPVCQTPCDILIRTFNILSGKCNKCDTLTLAVTSPLQSTARQIKDIIEKEEWVDKD